MQQRTGPRVGPTNAFIVGVVLVVVAVALAVGAVRFEFAYAGVTTDLANADWVVAYAELTPADRALVDAAIAGDRYVTDSIGALPGPGRGSLAVRYGGEFHAFTRRAYFDPTTDFGLAAIASATAGVLAVAYAFRSQKRTRARSPYAN